MSKLRYSAIAVELRLRQLRDPVRGPDQPSFLGAPPGEAQRVARRWLAEVLGDLEQGGRAAAVVVDARPGAHGVEVGAGHDDVVVVDALASRRSRCGRSASRAGHDDAGRGPRLGEGCAIGERCADDGDRRVRRLTERRVRRRCRRSAPSRSGVLPWLKMITALGAGGLRVVGLQGEAAAAPLDEGDRTRREAGEVVRTARVGDERGADGGLGERAVASARVGPRWHEVDVDRERRRRSRHRTPLPVNAAGLVRGIDGCQLLAARRREVD